jgi:hypothetical protein
MCLLSVIDAEFVIYDRWSERILGGHDGSLRVRKGHGGSKNDPKLPSQLKREQVNKIQTSTLQCSISSLKHMTRNSKINAINYSYQTQEPN